MFDRSAAKHASSETLATFDEDRIGYVTAMRSEQVGFLSHDAPLLPAGHRVFVLHAADGTPIVLAATRAAVMADAAQRKIQTVSRH